MTDLSHPPANPIEWEFHCPKLATHVYVTARTWFAARHQALAMVGCEPEALVLVRPRF